MHFFIRINGVLREVHVLTKASRDNPTVRVKVVATSQIMRVQATDILVDY